MNLLKKTICWSTDYSLDFPNIINDTGFAYYEPFYCR
ncbi:hypothetical protein J3U91_00194 [Oenococcus oeni]|nr:hypothetical protein AC229_0287 [Oenococcus oeni]UCU86092.1 hypothetical protein J3U91_00194 [Oenococcus oeni]